MQFGPASAEMARTDLPIDFRKTLADLFDEARAVRGFHQAALCKGRRWAGMGGPSAARRLTDRRSPPGATAIGTAPRFGSRAIAPMVAGYGPATTGE